MVPVAETFTPWAGAVPVTMGPVILKFAFPAKVAVCATDRCAERVNPPISRVFPAPLAVIVLPPVLVIFTGPIVNSVPVPAKFTTLSSLTVTVPSPRLRLLKEVLPAIP